MITYKVKKQIVKVMKRIEPICIWANTEKGERIIIRTLTTLSAVFIIDVALLVIGIIFEK